VWSHGYHLLQTMRFALEEINNSSSLLPNVTLGYDIYDTCSESANLYATLRALVQKGQRDVGVLPALQHYEPTAVAVIGPDTHPPCVSLPVEGNPFSWLPLQISYEASLETLSLKRLYPSFLRTIPSDGQQVKAIALLLQSFQWSWVALLGSDNAYGRDGLDALYELLVASGVCVAYRGIIPTNKDASSPELQRLVRILTDIRVNVTVVFSNVNSARPFFEVVVQNNITGMVWVASEDWSLAQNIWQLPGIQTIGSVIGMSVEQAESTMLEHLESWKYAEERAVSESAGSTGAGGENRSSSSESTWPNCTQQCPGCHLLAAAPNIYDTQASNNVYSAVYAVAHGLHDLLGCASGVIFFPLQCGFSPCAQRFSISLGGSSPSRAVLAAKALGQHSGLSSPLRCLLQQNRHRCCFSCVACPAGTFLNRTDPYTCQACGADEWSPARSELCFNRTLEFLSWAEPLSWALLAPIALLLLLLAALSLLFALHASTPLVRAAGGRLCFLMLGSLGCACGSLLCYFGAPSRPCCLLRLPLFAVGFAVFLSSVAARCLQLVAIFKLRGRCPRLRRACLRRRTPLLLVAAGAAGQAALCLAALLSAPPGPLRRRDVAAELLVLECGGGGAAEAAAEALNVALSGGCFALSYAGKDLPAAYREARCLTCGLLLHLACAAAALCTRGAFRGREAALAAVLGALCTLAPPLAGYFVPRGLALLLRPDKLSWLLLMTTFV
uniref:Taste 1 receptor member 1 n=1 Tax=Anas zonorhyncha TaxID=75864 RepID=A0A8B9ZX37_9AVES